MSRADNESVLRAHLVAETQLDMDATLATVHPECLWVDEQLGLRLEGRNGARLHYDIWWSAFRAAPDNGAVHWVDDDFVVGEAEFVGTHVGPFAGIPPTGQSIRLPFVVFVRFRDGLLAGERFVYDLNTLLRQLGQHQAVEIPAFRP